MNFFESQDNARRRTVWLVALFVLALFCLIGLTQLMVMVAYRFGGHSSLGWQSGFWSAFSWQTLATIAAGVVTVVALASFYKMQQLRAGGGAVAELLGGQLLDRASQEPDERKILNVVEEMAIASGVPVPQVFLLEEASINAFAAGHDRRDVAIGITRGAIRLLSRDELQGVIAHEFSHIFNGDMKINLQLIGWLHGILFIGLIGRLLLDGNDRRSWTRRNNPGGTAGSLAVLGLGFVLIGYCGTVFGGLIKAGISRQREYLADASAVQFTRNPAGIAGALKKIGGCPSGSRIAHPNAAQVSHLFFGNGLSTRFSLFATHPPIEDRIRAIDPHWDGTFPDVDTSAVNLQKPAIDPTHVHIINGEIVYTPTRAVPAVAPLPATAIAASSVAASLAAIGAPTAAHITTARDTLTQLPQQLQQLARETWGACALVHSLLMAHQARDLRQQHMTLLQQNTPGSVHTLCAQIMDAVQALPVNLRLPLIDLCIPSLKNLGTAQRQAFFTAVMAQIRCDQKISLFEWALYRLLRQHLDSAQKVKTGQLPLTALADECNTVLSALALATQRDNAAAAQAFANAWLLLGQPTTTLDTAALADMGMLDQRVRRLPGLQPLAKPRLLKACCAAITDNGVYTPESVELLRAIADTIDTPIPPVVTTQSAA